MALVKLERLRPQINAVASQYQSSEVFIRSLKSLMESYRAEIEVSASRIGPYTIIPTLNIPQIVMTQIEISLQYLAHQYPEQTKIIAETLWNEEYFDYKKIALILISNLPKDELDWYFEKLDIWVNEETEEPIIGEVLENAIKKEQIFLNKRWLTVIQKWILSKNDRIKIFGLSALTNLINTNSSNNLPAIFRLVEPIYSAPRVSINKELYNLIEAFTQVAEAETAAYLIHLATLYPNPDLFSFIRKCARLFDLTYASEINKRLPD